MTPLLHKTATRRNFLYATTAAMGAAGIVAAAWPFIAQMNPDARVRATDDAVDVSVKDLPPGQQKTVRWRNLPVLIVSRTPDVLAAMQEPQFAAHLFDPRSERRQQPDYARNWHRSIRPEYAVMVGVCTHCACILHRAEEALPPDPAGSYICPCCASHYDAAGRAYQGIAQFNLAVPSHAFIDQTTISIGRNSPGEIFTFASIERVPGN
jgi:ubiquinol-cytochrome c reductase iron-sulfur subunit